MTEKAHTPGPWHFDNDWHRLPTIFGADQKTMVCVVEKGTCSRDARPTDDRKSNAYLIAAAPDMLAALQEVEQWADDCADVDDGIPNDAMRMLGIVRTAIAKAIP